MKFSPKPLIFGGFLLLSTLFIPMAQAAKVSAWLPSWEVKEAFESFQNNKDNIDVISPFWYHVNEDGTLSPTANSEDQAIIDFAQENHIPVIPTISNSFDGKKISGLLNDPQKRTEHIRHITYTILEWNYDGIDIDYEGLLATDMDAFSAFIKELRTVLNHHEKTLTIAVMSQSYEMLPKFGTRGQDWAELAKHVDEFRIMTYDYGWRGSIPRPVAPHYWVEEVVKYAVDHVPLEKIRLGIPFYGYAWSDNGLEGGKSFSSYTYEGILNLLETYGIDFQYDPVQRTNRLFYLSNNDSRELRAPFEIWFENAVSLEPKLDLVEKYNLGGIAIWRLGREDLNNWTLIAKKLKDEAQMENSYFPDVKPTDPYYEAIDRLAFLGLVKGQGKTGLFDPNSKVNRAEILKMSLNSFAVDTSAHAFPEIQLASLSPSLSFPDVSEKAWYFAYVKTALDQHIVQGYPDGYFKPANNIIRVEALKLALESAGVDLRGYDPSTWYAPYRDWAFEHGLYSPATFVPGEEITRAEAAYILAKVIEEIERRP